jgi:hypothetical protein
MALVFPVILNEQSTSSTCLLLYTSCFFVCHLFLAWHCLMLQSSVAETHLMLFLQKLVKSFLSAFLLHSLFFFVSDLVARRL